MSDRFLRMRWYVGGVVTTGLLFLIAGAANQAGSSGIAKPAPQLPPDDGKLRIICFGAHPDDNEFQAGGVGAMWAAQGHHVKFVSVTNGDIGHWGIAGGPLAQRRTAEVQRCADILGIHTQVLDIHDGELLPTLQHRKTITSLIREWKADIVMCHRPNDYHPDHRNVGMLVQDAAYMVTVPFFCPDTPYLERNPVFLYYQDRFLKPNPFSADIVVGIDEVVQKKLAAVEALASQTLEGGCNGSQHLYPADGDSQSKRLQDVRQRFNRRFAQTASRFQDGLVRWYGEDGARQVGYAEAFEICEYGRRPNNDEIRRLFPFFPK